MSFHKTLLLIALICSLVQVSITEYNLSVVEAETLIKTADSPSYINPSKNLLESGVWKDNFSGESSFVHRPPFYGSLYLLSSLVSSNPFLILKIIHYLFLLTGIYFFGKTIEKLTKRKKVVIIATVSFGLLPFFHGFLGYVMTEAIAPYLMVLLVYLFISVYSYNKHVLLFMVVASAIILLRVQLIVFPITFTIAFLLKFRVRMLWSLLLFIPFFTWQLRVKEVTGTFQLHPIYSYTNESIFRPPHQELTNLFRTWEHDGEKFHKVESLLRQDTAKATLKEAMKMIPEEFQSATRNKLNLYQKVAFEQKRMWKNGENKRLEIEEVFVNEIDKWMLTYKSRHLLINWFYTPAQSLMELMKSSHLNLYVFQKKFRGNFFMELLRILSVSIIAVSVITSVLLLFIKKTPLPVRLTMLTFLISLLYLIFVQRMNETRYMTPYLPVVFIGLWTFYNHVRKPNA